MDKALEALERIASKQVRIDHGSVIKHVTLEQIDPEAIAIIRSALSGGWVSVEDRLPDERAVVIAYRPDDRFLPRKICLFSKGEFQNCVYSVTHWMPLPSPPETDHE